ncbi:FAD-binding oxidoreductase [Halorarum halophilum]|uniref:FAD-binding oxidoreductase n=1 Tax=Halorarum halophilum TaxID=2743090 RepID=A0A7D5K5S6_9EURY|nr:FAD-dependent oxidoreductase [Halobaculum halophilum]QLG26194.1 FAD-binding oxidoreductase [Halobaculum halophilum]
MRVAVIGAGAVGLTAARDLAAGGASVTVYDRGEPGSGSSGRAAGVLYDAYAEDVDAELGARAMERFREFSGTGGFEFRECPYVFLARTGDEDVAEAIPASVERMQSHGRPVESVTPAELGERFPTLRTDDVTVAAVAENAGWTDPGSYVEMMAGRAGEAGVELRPNESVCVDPDGPGVIADGGGTATGYDAVVVAAGAHTKRVLVDAGIPVPLKPYRVQALVSGTAYDGPMCYDATAGAYFRPHPTGLLGGDGTVPVEADPDDWDREADNWFVDELGGMLRHRADHDPAVERAWAGLCTATPDGDPLLGELREGLYVAAGWQGHGFMRAPAVGEAVAAQVLGKSDGIAPFDPRRFSGDETFEISEGMAVETDRDGA